AFGFHAGNAAAATVEIAHQVAGVFDGGLNFDVHDGLEQGRLGLLHGGFEGLAGGQLERQFRRIDVVVGAVVHRDFKIHHGKTSQEAVFGGLDDALFHSRNIVFGDGAAEDFIGELEFGAAR